MEFKGTKGNWRIDKRACLRIVSEKDITIASASGGQSGENEIEEKANARLIANAPKMLKFIELFIHDFECDYVMSDGTIVDYPTDLLLTHYKLAKNVIEEALK